MLFVAFLGQSKNPPEYLLDYLYTTKKTSLGDLVGMLQNILEDFAGLRGAMELLMEMVGRGILS